MELYPVSLLSRRILGPPLHGWLYFLNGFLNSFLSSFFPPSTLRSAFVARILMDEISLNVSNGHGSTKSNPSTVKYSVLCEVLSTNTLPDLLAVLRNRTAAAAEHLKFCWRNVVWFYSDILFPVAVGEATRAIFVRKRVSICMPHSCSTVRILDWNDPNVCLVESQGWLEI